MSQPTRIPPRRKSKGDGQFMFSALLIVIVIACLMGMTMTDQIAFLDKEVRKLWGHRKGYLDNFKKQETKSSQNEKNLQNLKAVSTGLEDQLSSINQKIQLAEDLQLKITLLTNELNKQKQVIETNQSSIDAVDSYRIQNNQKVADVLNRLNGLTRDLQAIETELKAIKEEGSNEQSP